MTVSLKAGGNYVVYSGKVQSAADALASIMSYLDPNELVYYWNNLIGFHEQVWSTDMMVPYGVYWIEVTQDCTWTYGAEETAPTWVYLWGPRLNGVPYCGKAIPPADAFSSILGYLRVVPIVYFNNETHEWELVAYFHDGYWRWEQSLMVPLSFYSFGVTQNCVWWFVAPEPPFTEITEIVAPDKAVAGETVSIEVKVKNLAPYAINITVTGRVDDLDLKFGDIYYAVPAGETQSFYDAFIMPSRDVRVTAWSWYKIDGWPEEPDDEATKDISLTEEVIYRGTISKKELEYNEARADIPASNIPQDKSGLVHIWGRNDMDTAQRMGIGWTVTDPDGVIVEEYGTWEAWPYTPPGEAHPFTGARFDLDKTGDYMIAIELRMNEPNPVVVDSYSGTLCTVVPELVPTFSNFGMATFSKV